MPDGRSALWDHYLRDKTNMPNQGAPMSPSDLENIKNAVASQNAHLVDVRENPEWDSIHLKGAQLCPLSELRLGNLPNDLPRDIPIYIYCRMGRRAKEAELLLQSEYNNVLALTCSLDELITLGFPTS